MSIDGSPGNTKKNYRRNVSFYISLREMKITQKENGK